MATRKRMLPGTRYERRTRTPEGREWLASHRECHDAYGYARTLLEMADELATDTLTEARRAELRTEIEAVGRVLLGSDASSLDGRRRTMVEALQHAALYLRAVTPCACRDLECTCGPSPDGIDGAVAAARSYLQIHHLACPDGAVLRRAVSLWPTSRKGKTDAIYALAVALRCAGDASPTSLRVELDELMRPERERWRAEHERAERTRRQWAERHLRLRPRKA